MKTHNKKRGFTIVELVIVIAVIAILSAVMVPTFSGVVRKAKESAAMQEANAAVRAVAGTTEWGSLDVADVEVDAYVIVDEDYAFTVKGNNLDAVKVEEIPANVFADLAAVKAFNAVDENTDKYEKGEAVYVASAENKMVYVYHVLTDADLA